MSISNLFTTLFTGPICQRWAMALLHFAWQGFAVALVLVIVLKLCRVRRPGTRYASFLLGMIVVAVLPLLTFAMLDLRSQPRQDAFRLWPDFVGRRLPSFPGGPLYDFWQASFNSVASSWGWIVSLWLAGVLVLGTRLLVSTIEARRLRQLHHPLSGQWAARVSALGERLGTQVSNRLFTSRHITEAFAMGFLRPIVLLPACWLSELSPEMVEAVIAHELSHIRRWDLWVNLFQRLIETLLFYHPAVWWLSARLRSERELCCDELAVATTGKRLAYAKTLEFLARAKFAATPVLVTGIGDEKMKMLARVRNVLGLAPLSRSSGGRTLGIVLPAILLGFGLVTASTFTPATVAEEKRAEPDAAAPTIAPRTRESRPDTQRDGDKSADAARGATDSAVRPGERKATDASPRGNEGERQPEAAARAGDRKATDASRGPAREGQADASGRAERKPIPADRSAKLAIEILNSSNSKSMHYIRSGTR